MLKNDTQESNIIRTKIRGVSFANNDGSSRQEIIKGCKVGQLLKLVHQPSKDHPNAIAVYTNDNKQLGHISSDLAKKFTDVFRNPNATMVQITDLTGGIKDTPTLGINIKITILDQLTSPPPSNKIYTKIMEIFKSKKD